MCKSDKTDLERLADDVRRMVETRLAELLDGSPTVWLLTPRPNLAAAARALCEEAERWT